MGFFNKTHKKLALYNSYLEIQQANEQTEFDLERASNKGDKKSLKKAMKEHGNIEYALLYKNTPEFKKKNKKYIKKWDYTFTGIISFYVSKNIYLAK